MCMELRYSSIYREMSKFPTIGGQKSCWETFVTCEMYPTHHRSPFVPSVRVSDYYLMFRQCA